MKNTGLKTIAFIIATGVVFESGFVALGCAMCVICCGLIGDLANK